MVPNPKIHRILVLLAVIILSASCSEDDIQKMYSRRRAYFYYNKVETTLPLKYALNSPGEYCAIYLQPKRIHFYSLNKTHEEPVTDNSMYLKYICIAGFIVGRGNMPETGAIDLPTLCYDLACPNCYDESSISKRLILKEGGKAECDRCHRIYDLNNIGMIIQGEKGKKLERYHVNYDAPYTTLIVYNQ